jgi:putative phosphoesterase
VTLIGVLSDSHGQVERTRAAVRSLIDGGAAMLVHLGDIETDDVIDELAGHEVAIVFGNCDDDISSLTRYAERLNISVRHPMGELTIDGKRIAFTHGHLLECVKQALAQQADYLLLGHTHEVRDERIGRTRVINPGALHRAARYTAALLDPGADSLRIVDIPR